MTTVLEKICRRTLEDLAVRKTRVPCSQLSTQIKGQSRPRGFAAALVNARQAGRFGLIAEIKRKSPSHGLIRGDFDPARLARAYEKGGAACLSVLTDAPFFGGADEHLTAARAVCRLPVLRKDFILDPYQVAESRALGADCILLILAALEDSLARELEAAALDYRLDVLIEVHDAPELERALLLKSPLIGINNRNLDTLAVDMATATGLAPLVPKDRLVVAESGYSSHSGLQNASKAAGITTFLVGEALMRQDNLELATRNLLHEEECHN